jgi:molybdopterin synthase catalytic subunit
MSSNTSPSTSTSTSTRAALSSEPLSVDAVQALVSHGGAGGIALFLGAVRDQNAGHAVTLLEYHAYPELAVAEMGRILDEIEATIPGVRLAVAHRVGSLAVGELAIVAAASAPHRGEAFRACRLLVDEVKARVPIWKREHGPAGPYWVDFQDARCVPGEDGHDHEISHEKPHHHG